MAVNYYLRPNKLGNHGNKYMASVRTTAMIDLEKIIEQMMARGSTVTRADIYSVLEDFQATLEMNLQAGINVTTPFANFSSSIRGVFESASDRFDPTRHHIKPIVNPGKRLKKFYRQRLSAHIVESGSGAPNLLTYVDYVTGERNKSITPGGAGQLIGKRLKLSEEDEREGIFFISQDRQEFVVEILVENRPSALTFMVPNELSPGEYGLELRRVYRGLFKSSQLPYRLIASE
jgi:hypothetical protein